MMKSLGIGAALLTLLVGAATAQTLIKKEDGVFISEKTAGKIAMKPGQRLIINAASTLGGELTLKSGGSDCQYVYTKLLKTPTKVEAGEYASVISVEAEQQKDAVILSLRAPAQAPWSGSYNSGRLIIDVTLPPKCIIEINSAYFDIDAVGPFSEFLVSESLSKVQVENVSAVTDIKVSNRPLNIKNITGRLSATNKYGRIKLENVDTGEEFGTVRNEHGEIVITGYRGGLDARTSYDQINAQDLFLTGSKNRFKNISAPINVVFDSLVDGTIRINNQYQHVNLEIRNRTDAQFICKAGERSTITADKLDLVPTMVDESRLEFICGRGKAEVRITARESGDITIIGPGAANMAGGRQ